MKTASDTLEAGLSRLLRAQDEGEDTEKPGLEPSDQCGDQKGSIKEVRLRPEQLTLFPFPAMGLRFHPVNNGDLPKVSGKRKITITSFNNLA